MDKRKSTSQIEREIQDALDGDATLFYPGGTGGGGSRRKKPGKPVVKAHARTYSGCRECTRLHSLEQHETHRGKVKSTTKNQMKTKTKSTKKPADKKKKAITKQKPSSAGRVPHPPLHDLPSVLDLIRAAVAPGGVPASGRYHGEKVFVAAIYDYLTRHPSKIEMSIDTFKRWLVVQNRDGNLVLARADLVGAMDRSLVNRSEIESYGATFHFVLAGSVKG